MHWMDDVAERSGPRYKAIADAIGDAVSQGRLAPGAQLPPHRVLADRLGVTVGTATRGYAEAARRGVVTGEHGRGTFVRPDLFDDTRSALGAVGDASVIDLSLNVPPRGIGDGLSEAFAAILSSLATDAGLDAVLRYQPHAGAAPHRQAGARWIGYAGLDVPAGEVLVTAGAQHGLVIVLSTMLRPGDVVLAEQLADPGLKDLANLLGLRLRGIPLDDEGLRPDALDAACRDAGARLLVCTPTLHNPTTATMPDARRRAVATVARAHDLLIVEDDVFGMLPPHRQRPIATMAPERTFYLTSLSKCLAPGLRLGYLSAPERYVDRLSAAMRATMWMAPPLLAEVAACWIEDGTAVRLVAGKREEAAARQALAAQMLGKHGLQSAGEAYHAWLPLREPWRSEAFVAEASRRGVRVTSPEAFVVGRQPAPHAVRLCLGAARHRAELQEALRVVADLIGEGPGPALSVT